MRPLLPLALLVALAAALAGCMDAEESNESGAGHENNPAGVGEGNDDVDPCDDEPMGEVGEGDCEENAIAPSV